MSTPEKNLPGSQGRFKPLTDEWASAPKPFTEDNVVGDPFCNEHNLDKHVRMYYHTKPTKKHAVGDTTHLGRMVCDECEKQHGNKVYKEPVDDIDFRAALRLRNTGVPTTNQHCTLSNYIPECTEQEEVYAKILSYAETLQSKEYKNLVMYGNSGTGKTHFGCALLVEASRECKTLYTTAGALIAGISESMSYNIPESAAQAKYVQADLLFVDEVKQHGRNELDRFLYPVIEARLSQRRSTIFATNHPIGMFTTVIGPNLTDKMKVSCLSLKFEWASFRGRSEVLEL
jgi:DNA replication protein DnaC